MYQRTKAGSIASCLDSQMAIFGERATVKTSAEMVDYNSDLPMRARAPGGSVDAAREMMRIMKSHEESAITFV